MPTTTNYGWTTPADTDLVKDGASAIRTLGTAIDTTVFNNAGAAIAKTIVDAKGDIIAATAADTVSRLAVGANDTVLTADSSTATGLKWAAPAGGGTVVKIQTGSATSAVASTSTTFVDTGLTVTITPTNTSSKILILGMIPMTAGNATEGSIRLLRGATSLQQVDRYLNDANTSTVDVHGSFLYLDSPATTSATTYKFQFRRYDGSGTITFCRGNLMFGQIVAIEIGA
jgi:hypothetical protein